MWLQKVSIDQITQTALGYRKKQRLFLLKASGKHKMCEQQNSLGYSIRNQLLESSAGIMETR